METDQCLLEKAAKIAGINGQYRTEHIHGPVGWEDVTAIFYDDDMGWWNPLTDDGDAFRLAVDTDILWGRAFSEAYSEEISRLSDIRMATRRAIVRAVVFEAGD